MNRYRHTFIVECPNNRARIGYTLLIETRQTIMVEEIIEACTVKESFHEPLADLLQERFGGRQTLRAFHHGVWVETIREDL